MSKTGKRTPERVITYLTQDETRRLFGVVKDKRDRALFRLTYEHGLRASEVGLLQRADVDSQQLRITITRLKGSLSGTYPLQPLTAKMLRSYLRSRTDASPYLFISKRTQPIHRRTLHDLMQRYGELAKIPEKKRHFHIFRHSIGVHLLDAGEDVYFVRDRLGHKNIQNTMEYVKYTTYARDDRTRKVFASHQVV